MSLKLYSVMGIGLIVGVKVETDEENIYLKHPGIYYANQQRDGRVQHMMMDPIPDGILESKNEILKRFPIKKSLILFSGKPTVNLISLYQQHEKNVIQRMTGLRLVSSDALNHLPKTGKGGPVIQ